MAEATKYLEERKDGILQASAEARRTGEPLDRFFGNLTADSTFVVVTEARLCSRILEAAHDQDLADTGSAPPHHYVYHFGSYYVVVVDPVLPPGVRAEAESVAHLVSVRTMKGIRVGLVNF